MASEDATAREDLCVNTTRLDLHGQERGAVWPPLAGNGTEENCGRVSTRQSPIGEGREGNELREGLVGSSRAHKTVAYEGGWQWDVVCAASCAAMRQRTCGVLWPRREAIQPTNRGCLNAPCIGAGRLPTHGDPGIAVDLQICSPV